MRMKLFLAGQLAFLCAATAPATAQQSVNETRDFGVPPTMELRLSDHATATPLALPGAVLIRTGELRSRLQGPPEALPLLFDVLSDMHETLPGAVWLPGAGLGSGFEDAVQAQLRVALEQATGGDKARPMAFFCSSERCWLSYNAALRAVRLGYSNVLWYRGGIAAWLAAGGELLRPRVRWKPPPG